jgi:hypothetical protein
MAASAWVVPVNYNTALRQANDYYDSVSAAAALPTYEARQAELKRIDGAIDTATRAGMFHMLANMEQLILADELPSMERFDARQTLALETADLARLSLALRAMKGATGAFPETLEALKSMGFDVPLDRFTGKPLLYARKGEGYLLYSVGENMQDDGGVREEDVKGTALNDHPWDIVVRSEK